MTPGGGTADFEAAWPSARAQLSAVLRGRGVQAADVDDIAQDVALRAMRASFDSEDHLVAWCCRVGINLHIDSTRRQARASGQPLAEPVANHDTAVTVERRLALEVLAKGIAELSDEERHLLFELEPSLSRREAVRLAVRRHRLRARLAALVEGMAAGVPVMRRLVRLRRSLSAPTKVSLAAAPLVAVGLMLGPVATGGRPPETLEVPATEAPLLTARPAPAEGTDGSPTVHSATQAPASSRPPARLSPSAASGGERAAVLVAGPAGVPVRVRQLDGPDDRKPLVCESGLVNACVARPPAVPEHTVPTVP